MKVYYMHTINGRPAFFDGDQICYMRGYGKPNRLADSLKQIRAEQRATGAYRRRMKFYIESGYGHYRVYVP